MGKMLISLTNETEQKLRKKASERFGKRRGAISFYVEDAIKEYMEVKK